MSLLVDGHNLVGKLPNLHLDDPDDEAKLVLRLRSYAARTGSRITVVFDRGMPGGRSWSLSGGGVDAIFAPTGRTADSVLCERIRRARDPRRLTVVSSDHEVIEAAQRRGARVMRSEVFAEQLEPPVAPPPAVEEEREVQLSTAEIEEWLELFGEG
ncbi:MAG TPA: hypothetical protein ENN99_14425 [Chloroflexi bacterium]|nr:hypothetical protein [Chloroflexota bacterium]